MNKKVIGDKGAGDNCRNKEYRNNSNWRLGIDAEKKAATKLQRLLNANFDEKDINVIFTYVNSVKNGSENGQQAID